MHLYGEVSWKAAMVFVFPGVKLYLLGDQGFPVNIG